MTSRNDHRRNLPRTLIIGVAAIAVALNAAGCGKKKKPAPPPPPPPKVVAPPPEPVDVAALLQQLKSDARVQFPSNQSPADRSLAEGIIKLANALAKGDAAEMKGLLAPPAQGIVDELVSSGGWEEGTKPIEQVRIVSVSGTMEEQPSASQVGFAIQGKDGAYLLAWTGARVGDKWMFQNAPCQKDVRPRASDFDGVSISGDFDLAAANETEQTRSTGGNAHKAPDAPAPEAPAPSGPRKKATPHGDVPIPGGTFTRP
jgi:hypothetical protein